MVSLTNKRKEQDRERLQLRRLCGQQRKIKSLETLLKFMVTNLGTDFVSLCQIRQKLGASKDGYT
jgi:hypothetical protein